MLMTVLMVVFGLGAVIALRSAKQGAAWGKPVSVICALVTIGLAVGQAVVSGSGANDVLKAGQRYRSALGECVGTHLADRYAGKKVIVLVEPRPEGVESPLGLQTGFEDRLVELLSAKAASVERVSLPVPESFQEEMARFEGSNDEYAESELSMFVSEMAMMMDPPEIRDFFISLNGQADVVVSAVTFGGDFSVENLPKAGEAPDLALLNVIVEDPQQALKSTALDVLVSYRLDAEYDPAAKLPEDDWDVFSMRYTLIDRDHPTGVTSL